MKRKSRLRRYVSKRAATRPPEYTIARLQAMNKTQLLHAAKALAGDYRKAMGENREALGNLILYIQGLREAL